MADVRDDPEWQAARAAFIDPGTDNADEAYALRINAAMRMREIERRYAADA